MSPSPTPPLDDDSLTRCHWVSDDPLYRAYHDREWGVPEWDDRALFEKLILDGFQAGLSWITILRKRENFRRAFAGFEPARIAKFGARDVERLMGDAGIVRNRAKIEGAVGSAKGWLALQGEGGFSRFVWQFVDGKPKQNRWRSPAQIPTASDESIALGKALKARGFAFVGPTIVYAFMQAVGMVNDHLVKCFRHAEVRDAAG
jgi:DNA-3-methyladenine glycosylase I